MNLRPNSPSIAAAAALVSPDEPHRFSKIREEAWDRFLVKSADLAAAHHAVRSATGPVLRRDRRDAFDRECGPIVALWVRLGRFVIALFTGSKSLARPSRDTVLAARTSQLARAVRGAQRARSGRPALGGDEFAGGAAWA